MRPVMGEGVQQRSQEAYSRTADVLARITESILRERPPAEVVECWRRLSVSMHVIDDRLDNLPTPAFREQFVEGVLGFLDGGNQDFALDPELDRALSEIRELLGTLDAGRRRSFMTAARSLFTITEKIKQEKDSKRFVELTRLEGQLTTELVIAFIPDTLRSNPRYARLIKALMLFGSSGNALDSALDIGNDYREGQVSIKPTLLNRLKLLRAALIDGAAALATSGIRLTLYFLKRIPRILKHVIQENIERKRGAAGNTVRGTGYTVPDGG